MRRIYVNHDGGQVYTFGLLASLAMPTPRELWTGVLILLSWQDIDEPFLHTIPEMVSSTAAYTGRSWNLNPVRFG